MKYSGRFLRVKNLARYQHYKDRNPPWIKLHQELLEDYDFGCLQDASKAHALCIMLLASRLDNLIPADPEWIGRRINATSIVDIDDLLSCSFLEIVADGLQYDSARLADCSQLAMPEGEGEKRERKITPQAPLHPGASKTAAEKPTLPAELDTPEFREVWAAWIADRKDRRKTPTARAVSLQLAKLRPLGSVKAAECIQHSIRNGYIGLFPEAVSGNGANGSGRRAPNPDIRRTAGSRDVPKPAGGFDPFPDGVPPEVLAEIQARQRKRSI